MYIAHPESLASKKSIERQYFKHLKRLQSIQRQPSTRIDNSPPFLRPPQGPSHSQTCRTLEIAKGNALLGTKLLQLVQHKKVTIYSDSFRVFELARA